LNKIYLKLKLCTMHRAKCKMQESKVRHSAFYMEAFLAPFIIAVTRLVGALVVLARSLAKVSYHMFGIFRLLRFRGKLLC
jgi:hypothetical protein